MSDEDDFITVNITCSQAGALALTLIMAAKMGVLDLLPPETQQSLSDFSTTMKLEIESQKTGI